MQFQQLYRELAQSTEMIRALLAGVEQEHAIIKPDEQSWSTLEVVCHLYDEEREDFREHLDFILNRQHEPWHLIDPEGWVTERKYNQQDFEEMKGKFFAERERSLEWLRDLHDPHWDTTFTTPYRKISAAEMLASWVAHDNLHIRQLVELRRAMIERISSPGSIEYAGDW
jgi:DinB family protein